ncbi:MAG: group II truncated hemoglobin, partial [Gammaproteobacteria bacterium]
METLEPEDAVRPAPPMVTPFQLLGGDEALIRRVVDRFYDLMTTAPEYRLLRGMHAADLSPMRDRLTWWLTGWLGGPPRYQQNTGRGICITAVHRPFPIDAEVRDQWLECMRRAREEVEAPAEFRAMIEGPLAGIAEFLRNC